MTDPTVTLDPLDRIRARPVAQGTHTFAYDPNDAKQIRLAEQAVDDAEKAVMSHPKSDAAKKRRTAARKKLRVLLTECVTVTLTVKAIGAAAMDRIQQAHPSTDGDDGEVKLDMDAVGPETLAASLVSLTFSDAPDAAATTMTDTDAQALWTSMSVHDQLEVWAMLVSINSMSSKVGVAGKD